MISALNSNTFSTGESRGNHAVDSVNDSDNSKNSPTPLAGATTSAAQPTRPTNEPAPASRGIDLHHAGPSIILGDKIFHFNKEDITNPARVKSDDEEYEAALVQLKRNIQSLSRTKARITADQMARENLINAAIESNREIEHVSVAQATPRAFDFTAQRTQIAFDLAAWRAQREQFFAENQARLEAEWQKVALPPFKHIGNQVEIQGEPEKVQVPAWPTGQAQHKPAF